MNGRLLLILLICFAAAGAGFYFLNNQQEQKKTSGPATPEPGFHPVAPAAASATPGEKTAAGTPSAPDAPAPQTPTGQEPATATSEKSTLASAEKPAPVADTKSFAGLDADHNGLYDDTERKAVLEALGELAPELKGDCDTDRDGKVTPQEQTAGRHPLSLLVPASAVQDSRKIPWAIDLFPEWIMTAYVQEDVAPGAVAAHNSRGNIPVNAGQTDAALQPEKTGERSGVAFSADSGRYLSMPGHTQARWNYRWCIFTFRIDASSGKDNTTVLLDLNQGNSSSKSSPKIWYDKASGLNVQYLGYGKGGLDKRLMTAKNVIADGKTWNALVCGIRQGRMYAAVNGVALTAVTPQPGRFSGDWINDSPTSFLGDKSKGNMAWAYDALIFGESEPSEAMVRKMSGWAAHRLGVQSRLPEGHPYRVAGPVMDAEDFPRRYVHDNDKWLAWGAKVKDKSITRVNAGGPRVEPQGFERVFYDDFRAERVRWSGSNESDLWAAPGLNIAVGASAKLARPGQKPDVYPYDSAKQKQVLSLARQNNRWIGSAFYSINDSGQGYDWAGPKIFRTRCLFPKMEQKQMPGGLFPAFWSYGTDHLFWRTSNRIEVDWFEFDGVNGRWLNGVSTHYHYPYVKNIFVKSNSSYPRFKVFGSELTEQKSKIPGGIFAWDGQYHTWEYVVDKDMFYINVTTTDKDGKESWHEICRAPTAPTYLERLFLIYDYAYKAEADAKKPKDFKWQDRYDFVVDWVEVLQKTSQIESFSEPFTARPALSGNAIPGGTVTCQSNVKGIEDIRYYWFADDYPLTYGAENTLKLTAAEAGTSIRCMVKAVGARNMPEAWSAPLSASKR